MSKTYYTKCGTCFKKSSSAGVTRYEEITDKCKGCEYIEQTTTYRGGKKVEITFCQAGSKKPNSKNDYQTTCESDATTLSIISLDLEFLKEVYDFACSKPGFTRSADWPRVFHGLDREDCRKSMPLYFENNKKGKSAKKAIIEKYFKELQEEKFDSLDKCYQCDSFHLDTNSKEVGSCSKRMTLVTRNDVVCYRFNPLNIVPDDIEVVNDIQQTSENIVRDKPKKSELQGRNVTKRGIKFRDYFYTAEFLKQYWKQTLVIKVVEGSPDKIEVYADYNGDKFLGYIERSHQKYETGGLLISNTKSHNDKKVGSNCTDYTINELIKLGFDLGTPSSPTKENEHLIKLLEEANAHEQTCTNCKFRGSYQDYVCDDGSFYWKCKKNNDMVASNVTICCNYERMEVLVSMHDSDNEFSCSQDEYPFHTAMELVNKQSNTAEASSSDTSSLDGNISFIRRKCKDIVNNYIEIGFSLIDIKNRKLFKDRGYDNLIDCVEAELNMKKSSVYNFIKIAEKFGDPETKSLKSEYSQYNYAQCIEMSTMTKDELNEINPDMSKRDMQEMKKSNRLEKSNVVLTDEKNQSIKDNLVSGDNVIDIVNYKVVSGISNLQTIDQAENNISDNSSGAAAHKIETNNNQHDIFTYLVQENEQDSEDNNITNKIDSEFKNDNYNDLLLENENYRLRVERLEQEKRDLSELIRAIDKKFNSISKNQIRNCIADFITTGQIMFQEN
jgi:hypothetical protein